TRRSLRGRSLAPPSLRTTRLFACPGRCRWVHACPIDDPRDGAVTDVPSTASTPAYETRTGAEPGSVSASRADGASCSGASPASDASTALAEAGAPAPRRWRTSVRIVYTATVTLFWFVTSTS